MAFLANLAFAVIFTFIFRKPIKKVPWIFYIVALALSVLYYTFMALGTPTLTGIPKSLMIATMQKGSLGMAFFIIVMYIGVLSRSSKLRNMFNPIRGELSIIAWFLVMGHVVFYLQTQLRIVQIGMERYLERQPFMFFGAVVCGLLLFVLLAVLGITSFNAIRKAMKTKTWKKIQAWAYVFYAGLYAHLVLVLLPSALANGMTARISIAVYTVIFGVYLVLRIRRASIDRKAKQAKLEKSNEAK